MNPNVSGNSSFLNDDALCLALEECRPLCRTRAVNAASRAETAVNLPCARSRNWRIICRPRHRRTTARQKSPGCACCALRRNSTCSLISPSSCPLLHKGGRPDLPGEQAGAGIGASSPVGVSLTAIVRSLPDCQSLRGLVMLPPGSRTSARRDRPRAELMYLVSHFANRGGHETDAADCRRRTRTVFHLPAVHLAWW